MKRIVVILILLANFFYSCQNTDDGWMSLFSGNSLDGWKAAENPQSFHVENGMIVCNGPRAHLFYTGSIENANFNNFEFKTDVMTRPNSNSGIYFHTVYQEQGWPGKGFEAQVNNSYWGSGNYREYKKTGSLYGIRNLYKTPVKDNEWFTMHIIVKGKNIKIKINDRLVVDYVEPESPNKESREISSGTFAFQCHDENSRVFYKNIMVKPLPEHLPTPGEPVEDRELDERITQLHRKNFPIIDFHVHLKGGLTLEQAMARSRKHGINYGIAVNCGLGFPVTNDDQLDEFINNFNTPEAFMAMQAEGREWMTLFSKQAIDRFDYVFTDAMTWTNGNGKRMRLWINEEVEIGDKQDFMEMYVDRIVKILNNEPIDIFVNPTFLPDMIRGEYDILWTPERMKKVIQAAVDNKIAIEINDRYRIPSATFIKLAKTAGAKFSFGTNNSDKNYGNLKYCLDMITECGLTAEDMFMP